MVKLGFIVEGDTEKILLESEAFKNLLSDFQLDYVSDIINAGGNGNLLPHNIEKYTSILKGKGATQILILTDLDKDICVTETKKRIQPSNNHICIVAKKAIEAWFLSDADALNKFIEQNIVPYTEPESFDDPFEEIRKLRISKNGRGFNSKRTLANNMLANGFSFERASNHENCSSAKYFIDKLKQLSKQN